MIISTASIYSDIYDKAHEALDSTSKLFYVTIIRASVGIAFLIYSNFGKGLPLHKVDKSHIPFFKKSKLSAY